MAHATWKHARCSIGPCTTFRAAWPVHCRYYTKTDGARQREALLRAFAHWRLLARDAKRQGSGASSWIGPGRGQSLVPVTSQDPLVSRPCGMRSVGWSGLLKCASGGPGGHGEPAGLWARGPIGLGLLRRLPQAGPLPLVAAHLGSSSARASCSTRMPLAVTVPRCPAAVAVAARAGLSPVRVA
jgi:hypothetical protein